VLSKPELENSIVVQELVAIMENLGIKELNEQIGEQDPIVSSREG